MNAEENYVYNFKTFLFFLTSFRLGFSYLVKIMY